MSAARAHPPLEVADRFDGEAAWAALPEAVRTAIGANLLSGIVGEFLVAHGKEVRDERYVRVGFAAQARVNDAVGGMLADLGPPGAELPSGAPRIPALLGMVCERCGCSELDACPGGCGWAGPNLCTACADGAAG